MRRLALYVPLAVLMLGTGLGIGLGLSEAPVQSVAPEGSAGSIPRVNGMVGVFPTSTPYPAATTARFHDLVSIVRWVNADVRSESTGPVKEALIVRTTLAAASTFFGVEHPAFPKQTVDVVILTGRFVCRSCSGPVGASVPRGTSEAVLWMPGKGVADFSIGPSSPNPDVFGSPYQLPSDDK